MSKQNVEVAKRAIAAFNAREVEAFADLTTPDFEWSPSMSAIENEKFFGREGIHKYFDSLRNAWERFQVVPDRFRDQADRVLALGRLEGRGRSSGATVDSSLGMVFTFRGGMISRIDGYLDHAEALNALGLAADGGSPQATQ